MIVYHGSILLFSLTGQTSNLSTLKQQGAKAFIWDFSGKMAMHGMGVCGLHLFGTSY